MTVINSFSPVIKFSLGYEAERTDCRPKATNLYSISDTGQRILIPAGNGTYDLYIYSKVPELTGNETDQQLRQIADLSTPATYIETQAPHLILNKTYIFVIGKICTKFLHSRSRLMGNKIHVRYWFFSATLGEDQIQARIRCLTGRIYLARAEKIVESCKNRRKPVEPYKDLKRVIEFFIKIGQQLTKYGNRVFVRCTAADKAAAPVSAPEKPDDQQRQAAAAIVNVCREFLPLMYPIFCIDLSMIYPGLMGIPSPVAAGG